MKKLLQLAFLMALGFGVACEGPEGPEGPAGPPGEAGAPGAPGVPGPAGEDASTGTLFHIPPITFNAENEYQWGFAWEDAEIEIADTDVVLVYMPNGTFQDEIIWTPLPQTFYEDGSPIAINYAYSHRLLLLFVQGDPEVLASLGSGEDGEGGEGEGEGEAEVGEIEMFFRVIIVPGEALEDANARTLGGREPGELSSLSYKEALKTFNLSDEEVPLIQLR